MIKAIYINEAAFVDGVVTGATNLGSGNGTVFTTVSANKINLKTLSGGTNITLTCNGNYIAINANASSNLIWTGNTANGVGTYVSATRICTQPNMTFDGTQLKVTGNICATTCVRSALISGATICGGIVSGGTCVYSPKFCTTGQLASTLATGTSPFTVASTTLNTNLNADLLDGIHGTGYTSIGLFNTYTGATKTILDFHQTEIDRLSTLQGGVTYYFEHQASDIVGYESLLRAPITLSGVSETANINNNTVAFDSYATVLNDPSLTGISAGLWTVHFHVSFSTVTATNFVHADIYTRTTGGTETFRFRMSTPDINTTALTEYQLQDIQSGFTMNPSDRIVVRLLAQTTGGARTATFQYGSLTNFAFVIPPFTISTAPLWSNIQGKPQWLTGTTLGAFEAGHSHSQYALQTAINTFTGTTLPANYYNKTQINSYTASTNTRITNIETKYVSGATNLGSGNGTIYTSVNDHKIQLKTLSGGTNVTLTCNGNYIGINSSASPMAVCTISGNSSATGFTVNHGCNKQFVMVQVVQAASPYATVYTDVQRPNVNCVCIMFDTAPPTGTNYNILITA